MTSPRRRRANLLDARRATAPRAPEGRQKPSARVFEDDRAARHRTFEDEVKAVRERVERFRATFAPSNEVEVWLLERLAAETLTFERCARHEGLICQHLARRSETMWDDDRRLAALDLAAKLAGDPERIAARLRDTSQGCDLMIERWEDLVIVLELRGGWEERHRARAMDLLGLPVEGREGDPLGLAAMTIEELVTLIAAEVEALEARKAASLDQHDADERALAARGEFVDAPRPLKQARRYTAESYRRILWLWSQLPAAQTKSKPSPKGAAPRAGRPDPAPAPVPPPPPAPAPTAPTREEVARREMAGATPIPLFHPEYGVVRPDAPPPVLPVSQVRIQAELAPRPDRRSRPDPKALKKRRRR